MRLAAVALFLVTAVVSFSGSARGDEGMWTFDSFPAAKVKAAYGFAPDKAWLDRIQKGSVRLESGCSGAVVSRSGLVLTNHHCISECAQALSSAGNDLSERGYLALARRDEKVCPGLEASILQTIVDVTGRIKLATANVAPADVAARRRAAIAEVERQACKDEVTKRCEVVSLYRGGAYKLYVYDRYEDVRLVFAPEQQAAYFGGDPDNFNFPRFDFDVAVLRLYSDGKPAGFPDPLVLDPDGPRDGELVFVAGHPGSTSRLMTAAQLEFERDHALPRRIEYLAQLRGSLLIQSTKGEEEARQALDALNGVENSIKVVMGEREALVERALLNAKSVEEAKLREALAKDPKLRAKYGDPFAEIERLVAVRREIWTPYDMLEARFGAGSVLLADARRLVRSAAERAKPDGQRLPEFNESRLNLLERLLFAEAPVHPTLEQVEIEFWLNKTREYLGADAPAVKALFGGRSAAEIASRIVAESQLADPAVRRRLWARPDLIAASSDPALSLAGRIDAAAREARMRYETAYSGPLSVVAERLAGLRFDVDGLSAYPDATFTLRLSYGAVKGWIDPVRGSTPAFTRVSGLFERATGAFPFNLGAAWAAAESKLTLKTAMNFTATTDIAGGDSGSPVLDRRGRVVGLVFDGNRHALGGAFGFDPELNRTVAVTSSVLFEGLRNVYNAGALADELLGRDNKQGVQGGAR